MVLGGKTFPESRFRWLDRWSMPNPVRTSQKVSITGKTIVFAQAQTGGRTLTLEGWLTQTEFADFLTLYAQPGQDFFLRFDSGDQFPNVVILSVESAAVLEKNNPNWVKVTAKLMTVAS